MNINRILKNSTSFIMFFNFTILFVYDIQNISFFVLNAISIDSSKWFNNIEIEQYFFRFEGTHNILNK